MEHLPFYIAPVFLITLLGALYLFYKASGYSKAFLLSVIVWVLLQTIISLTGFYTVTDTLPPRILFLLGPPVVAIIALFVTKKGRRFIDSLDIQTLTIFHSIRVPVELVLFWLFTQKMLPELMTFEGRNFDILSGLSAPLVYYFGFVKKKLSTPVMICWNIICLALLANIVTNAVLSAPGIFQQQAFEQPNRAILYFPFTLLPACLVPMVLFAHLATIWKLLTGKNRDGH